MVSEFRGCVDALEHTLPLLDLPHEAEAIVALARSCAFAVDAAPLSVYATTARAYLKVLQQLDQYRIVPDVVDEDPFDALSRRLAAVGDEAD